MRCGGRRAGCRVHTHARRRSSGDDPRRSGHARPGRGGYSPGLAPDAPSPEGMRPRHRGRRPDDPRRPSVHRRRSTARAFPTRPGRTGAATTAPGEAGRRQRAAVRRRTSPRGATASSHRTPGRKRRVRRGKNAPTPSSSGSAPTHHRPATGTIHRIPGTRFADREGGPEQSTRTPKSLPRKGGFPPGGPGKGAPADPTTRTPDPEIGARRTPLDGLTKPEIPPAAHAEHEQSDSGREKQLRRYRDCYRAHAPSRRHPVPG
ncbi:hypothetical protein B4N89_46195 [Embleya scabrispora]|uniref:Uncharacterized protein n=1 Tax=Embleya scabrispora TaxID=159449 RepID=A0A1T3NJ39_9ACTN|nr:hypothetical protein B4N89_46195 [Embleya scabrispora]